MSFKKSSKSNKFFIFLGVLFLIILLLYGVYYKYFSFKTEVKSLNSSVSLDKKYIFKKLLPDKFDINLKEAFVESNASFSEDEITDLFILAFNEIPSLKENIDGLKASIEDSNLNLYLHSHYKGIPIEPKLTFVGENTDGKAIFHYKEGNIGFINISKEDLFSKFKNTSLVQFDKDNGNIILSFENLKHIQVTNLSIKDNKVNITFKGSLNFSSFSK